jgi:hypothetical protein
MLRRDACRNLSKMGAISALSSSLPFLFAQLTRTGRMTSELQSDRVHAEQINISCEEISQIAVWCSLADVVSKKALLHEVFFSSVGLALQACNGSIFHFVHLSNLSRLLILILCLLLDRSNHRLLCLVA